MNIQKHYIKNVEGSGQGKMIYLYLLTAINNCKSKMAAIKIDTATTITEAQNKRIIRKSGICTFKVVRNSFPFSITTELYERFTRL